MARKKKAGERKRKPKGMTEAQFLRKLAQLVKQDKEVGSDYGYDEWVVTHTGEIRPQSLVTCPITFVGGGLRPPGDAEEVGEAMGMSVKLINRVVAASDYAEAGTRKLRAKILEAVGLL